MFPPRPSIAPGTGDPSDTVDAARKLRESRVQAGAALSVAAAALAAVLAGTAPAHAPPDGFQVLRAEVLAVLADEARCGNCGVVEFVVPPSPESVQALMDSTYRIRIRMSDGSVRTVDQAQVLQKGAHVVVDRHGARLARIRTAQS